VRERDAFYFAADSKDARSRAVLDGAMKLVEIFDGVTWRGQLFDVVADPAERYDLSNERSEQRERLAAKLAHWYDGELGSPERLPGRPRQVHRERLASDSLACLWLGARRTGWTEVEMPATGGPSDARSKGRLSLSWPLSAVSSSPVGE
jgi:hypothetical protein